MKITNSSLQFKFEQIDDSSANIFANDQKVAEIKDLQLCNVRFKSEGPILLGNSVPMPLFWWQYANHEDPERNTGSNGKLIFNES